MKIALLTDGIPPYVIGGMQKHSYYLAKYLARNGVYVDLYHAVPAGTPSEAPEELTAAEQDYIRFIPLEFPQLKYFPGHYLRASYLYSEQILAHLKDHLEDVDFIYAQGFTGWALLCEKSRGLKTPPIAINLHGLEMFQRPPDQKTGLQHWMFRPAVKRNLHLADIVFSLGGKLTGIIESAGVPRNRIVEIPIGIETDWLAHEATLPSVPRKFVFVGRYERRKGIEELYKVLKELLPREKFEFHFIGPIPDTIKIDSPCIKYWGLIKDSEKIQKVLSCCDVLVCPSHSEGMPTVILEAMATGLAVIATDVGAVSKLVSDETGWLIAPGDQQQLQEAMVEAMNTSSEALMAKKRAGQLLVKENFTWDIIIQQTISEIDKIIGVQKAR